MIVLPDYFDSGCWYWGWCNKCPRELFIPYEATTDTLSWLDRLLISTVGRYAIAMAEFVAENHRDSLVKDRGGNVISHDRLYDFARDAVQRVRDVVRENMEDFSIPGESIPQWDGRFAPSWHMLVLDMLSDAWRFIENTAGLAGADGVSNIPNDIRLSEFRKLTGGLPLPSTGYCLLAAQLGRELMLAWKRKYPGPQDASSYQTPTTAEVEAAIERREAVKRLPSPNADRNKWIYEQRQSGITHKTIIRTLAKNEEGWEPITRPGGINLAADAHAEANDLPKIRRSGGRPKRS